MEAPFPFFGGKRRAAALIWERFGDVLNYVEPFAGSLAVLLARPTRPRIETVNDIDGFIANFWRAVSADPDAVAHYTADPIHEVTLHARHRWLMANRAPLEQLLEDPDYYDAKIAGWWAWGKCWWIGRDWCKRWTRQIPELDNDGRGLVARTADHKRWLQDLSQRLRRTRVCCGDFERILSPAALGLRYGPAAVLLDPPYPGYEFLYCAETGELAERVQSWARNHGDNPLLRIALCGYEGDYHLPKWDVVEWKAKGGYGNQGGANTNRFRERIWFSPHCLKPRQMVIPGIPDHSPCRGVVS